MILDLKGKNLKLEEKIFEMEVAFNFIGLIFKNVIIGIIYKLKEFLADYDLVWVGNKSMTNLKMEDQECTYYLGKSRLNINCIKCSDILLLRWKISL